MKANERKIRSILKRISKLQNEINSLLNEFDSEFEDSGLSLSYQPSDGWIFLNNETSGNISISDENIRKIAEGESDFYEFN